MLHINPHQWSRRVICIAPASAGCWNQSQIKWEWFRDYLTFCPNSFHKTFTLLEAVICLLQSLMWVWDGGTESQERGNSKVDRVPMTCPTSRAPVLDAQTAPELGLTAPADSYSQISLSLLWLFLFLLCYFHTHWSPRSSGDQTISQSRR